MGYKALIGFVSLQSAFYHVLSVGILTFNNTLIRVYNFPVTLILKSQFSLMLPFRVILCHLPTAHLSEGSMISWNGTGTRGKICFWTPPLSFSSGPGSYRTPAQKAKEGTHPTLGTAVLALSVGGQ